MNNSNEKKLTTVNQQIIQWLLIISFVSFTTLLFLFLNNVQPKFYIDEAFHIPQTQRYCNATFSEWDNKITTLPGLYLLSASILGPLKLCSTFNLRIVNLIATFLNFYFIYKILNTLNWTNRFNTTSTWFKLITSLNITIFPPLFFWHFLYYTDVLSINLVLLMYLLHQKNYYNYSALIGALSILTRQTNVIWIILLAGEKVITIIEQQTPQSISILEASGKHTSPVHAKILWNNFTHHAKLGVTRFIRFIGEIFSSLKAHIVIVVSFIIFIILNKGIVLGDRSAHVATIHLPQIFYFSVFCFIFSWPYMLPHLTDFLRCIRKHWIITQITLVLITVIVDKNTLVHPYILADNRHYVFYIWNKLFNRYFIFRYLMIPLYTFTIYALYSCLKDLRFLSKVLYFICISIILIPQLLLEPRYFVIPYVLLRLNMPMTKTWQLYAELLTSLIINFLQFYIFTTKTFYWTDQEGPQRISW